MQESRKSKFTVQMDRRNFLRSLVGGVAVAAAARTFPFRVFSFSKEVVGYRSYIMGADAFFPELAYPYLTKEALRKMVEQLKGENIMPFNGDNFHYAIHPEVAKQLKLYPYQSTLIDV